MSPAKKPTQLAILRRKAGMTQFDLAARAGVSLSTVVKMERGERVQRGMVALLAIALGVKLTSIQQ